MRFVARTHRSRRLSFISSQTPDWTYRFFLCSSPRNEAALAEAAEFGDMEFLACEEDYYKIPTKTLMMLGWAARHSTSQFIGKVDDDIFLDIPRLIARVRAIGRTREAFFGLAIPNGTPFRDPSHKWHIAREDYAEEFFPEYCQGSCYFLSNDLALTLDRCAEIGEGKCRLLPFEDVSVGVVLRNVPLFLSVSSSFRFVLIVPPFPRPAARRPRRLHAHAADRAPGDRRHGLGLHRAPLRDAR